MYPEPLKQLVEQKVPPHQILLIYGGPEGPLAGTDGRLDHRNLDQEIEKPGSVVPGGWQHPDEIARKARVQSESERRLSAVEDRETGDSGKLDPASIEDLLREGQNPDVVAKVKGVDMEEVEKVAGKLRSQGIEVNERPNTASLRAPQEHAILPEADAALQPRKPPAEDPEGQADKVAAAAKPSTEKEPDPAGETSTS